jgi:hypothetical protein
MDSQDLHSACGRDRPQNTWSIVLLLAVLTACDSSTKTPSGPGADQPGDGQTVAAVFADTSLEQAIRQALARPTGPDGFSRDPEWSPDGTRIAFENWIGVYSIAAVGTSQTAYLDHGMGTTPAWLMAASRLLYCVRVLPQSGPMRINSDIWLLDLTTKERLNLTDLFRCQVETILAEPGNGGRGAVVGSERTDVATAVSSGGRGATRCSAARTPGSGGLG